ncbi:hypothetical protein TruAng_002415 [Truncatella angustata]|nr:hypothetical protein TruAng_002415 [Truncatella angustata]
MCKKVDPSTGRDTDIYLEDTNERIHSSVRVRLACQGLAVNDDLVWNCPPLTKLWRPRQVAADYLDPISEQAAWGPPTNQSDKIGQPSGASAAADDRTRWVWEYAGPDVGKPPTTAIVEENLGPFEKHLQKLSCGKGVLEKAAKEGFKNFKFSS